MIVNVNGQIFEQNELHSNAAKISVFDRAYLYGDSLYEVARTYHQKLYAVEEHLLRLAQSASLSHLKLSQSLSFFAQEMSRTTEVFFKNLPPKEKKNTEAYCRIIVSRGEGKIGFGHSCIESKTLFTIIVQKLSPPTSEQFQKGYAMKIVDRHRNSPFALTPAMKSGNYLNNLLAYLEATEQSDFSYDDALMCDSRGFLTEGTTFNLFYVRRGMIATPPFNGGILDGITRRKVIELARKNKIEVRETYFTKERLYEADEVFLTSTIKEVFPITRLDEIIIGKHTQNSGKPGPVTVRLAKLFKKNLP